MRDAWQPRWAADRQLLVLGMMELQELCRVDKRKVWPHPDSTREGSPYAEHPAQREKGPQRS